MNIYFPNLNGLRFLAALMVLICHLELFKQLFGMPNVWNSPIILSMGSMGVDLFFVLSGFLITYLLLAEKKTTGSINLPAFYIRRILRIWPLYFFIVLLTFFVVPFTDLPFAKNINSNFGDRLTLYMLILPNVALAVFPGIHYASMTWSIGIEEQFYIFWPLLLILVRKTKWAILSVLIVFMGFKVGLFATEKIFNHIPASIKDIVVGLRIECMAAGGLGAYLAFRKKELNIIYNKWLQWAVIVSLFPLTWLLNVIGLDDLLHWVYSVVFFIIIVNAATNKKTVVRLENGVFNILGKISYGIYMYQYFAVVFSLLLCRYLIKDGILFNVLYYSLSLTLLIAISYASYFLFEKKFLALKHKPIKRLAP